MCRLNGVCALAVVVSWDCLVNGDLIESCVWRILVLAPTYVFLSMAVSPALLFSSYATLLLQSTVCALMFCFTPVVPPPPV